MGKLGLVLSGGGARGAYEVGVIHYIRTALSKKVSSIPFQILCGSSAGAINTGVMASLAHDPYQQGILLKELWLNLKQDNIYRRDWGATTGLVSSSMVGMMRNFLSFNLFSSGEKKGPHLTSLLDTRPLKEFLSQKIPWKQIDSNIQSGFLEALSITATNTRTGNSELFIQKKQDLRYTGDYRYYDVQMSAEHVMASAAIPIVFPTVKVGKFYYTDGGIRLYTPMSPAIQLGADRILIVGLRHAPSEDEVKKVEAKEMRRPPLLTEVLGRVMNGLFLDRVRYDLEQLDRINKLIEWSEEVYGKEYLKKLNETIFKLNESKDIAARGLKKIQAVQILPTEFISDIFQRWFNRKNKKDFKFAPMEKLLTRLLEVDAEGSVELLSYLIFAQEYIEELIDLGYEDAKKNKDKIIEVMEGK